MQSFSSSFFFLVALVGLAGIPAGLAASSATTDKETTAKQCSATSFFDRKQAYTSGIIFKNSEKTHQPCYGHFWNDINLNTTKNVGLKDHQYGYKSDLKGYGWGNITLPGYVGGAQDFLLGIQMAIGSASGLLSSSVEKAMYDGLQGKSVAEWVAVQGLPDLSSPAGTSMRAGILSVWNSTLIRAVEYSVEEDSKVSSVKRSEVYDWNLENKRQMSELSSSLKDRSESSEDDDGCSTEEDDEDEDASLSKYTKAPEECALYRAPWIASKPIYFNGQCDNCDKSTGFNAHGFGSFQSCSLIYQGKEFKGKTGKSDSHNFCTVEYDC